MKKNVVKKISCLALAGIAAFNMAGCSGGSTASDASAGSAQDTANTSSDGVRKIVVGVGNAAAPFCYLDENGSPSLIKTIQGL